MNRRFPLTNRPSLLCEARKGISRPQSIGLRSAVRLQHETQVSPLPEIPPVLESAISYRVCWRLFRELLTTRQMTKSPLCNTPRAWDMGSKAFA